MWTSLKERNVFAYVTNKGHSNPCIFIDLCKLPGIVSLQWEISPLRECNGQVGCIFMISKAILQNHNKRFMKPKTSTASK